MQLNEMVPNWLQHGSTLKIFRLSCCKACTSGQEQVRRQQASDLDNVVSKPSRTFLLGFEPFCGELEKTEELRAKTVRHKYIGRSLDVAHGVHRNHVRRVFSPLG